MGVLTIKFNVQGIPNAPASFDNGRDNRSREITLPDNRTTRYIPGRTRPSGVGGVNIVNSSSINNPGSRVSRSTIARPSRIPQTGNPSGITVSEEKVTSYRVGYRLAQSGDAFTYHPLVTKSPVVISNLPEGVYEVTLSTICNGVVNNTITEISQTDPSYYV